MKKYFSDINNTIKSIVYKDNIKVQLLNDHKHWKLLEPLKIIVLDRYIVIPKGFISDFASVPKFLKGIVPDKYIYNQIGILHDFLYTDLSNKYSIPKEEADIILREGIKSIDPSLTSDIMSELFYYSVKIFGEKYWEKTEHF